MSRTESRTHILFVTSSARGDASYSNQVAARLLDELGDAHPEATLTVRKAGEKPLEYMIVKLTDVLITSVSTGGSGGDDKLTENVTLNFGKVKVSYQPQKKDGSKDGGPVDMGWDISANTELK